MDYISKATDAKKFFSEVLDKVKTASIVGVYAHTLVLACKDSFTYIQDTPIYIMFDNGKCLVIDYMFIDEMNAEYRAMTVEEQAEYDESEIKDCFNRCTDFYDTEDSDKVIGVEKSALPYGRLTSIELEPVDEEYSVWSNGDIIGVAPTEETFGLITFKMDNGKEFYIWPGTAYDDGYSFLFSSHAVESEEDV